MNKAQVKHLHFISGVLLFFGVVIFGLAFQGCQLVNFNNGNDIFSNSSNTTSTPTRNSAQTSPRLDPAGQTVRETPENGYHPIWGSFAPPSINPATPIPPPLTDLDIDDEVMIWMLLGTDTEPPFTGRTEAIHLVFINPRFSKASLVSIPGDLFVYIPGYTMQRLNIAYSLGGIETLRETLAYNFNVRPSRFVLAHPGDFQWLVDDLNKIDVTIFYPIPHHCGGIRAGLIEMDGALALCYASYRDGMDEIDRMRRQQQMLRVIYRKLTRDGNLIQIPILFTSYQGWVKTDFSLEELLGYIPLALRLGDTERIGYYMLGWDQISLWDLPDHSQAQVFLPDQASVRDLLQQAINDVMTPKPLTDQVRTLEAQLTAAYQVTASAIPTLTPTPTATPDIPVTPEITHTPVITFTPQPTPEATLPGYP